MAWQTHGDGEGEGEEETVLYWLVVMFPQLLSGMWLGGLDIELHSAFATTSLVTSILRGSQ